MPDLLIEGAAVTRRFQQGNMDVYALRPASFQVRSGDRIALLGPSGSGKSTLLHLMADLDRPSTGQLTWPALGPSGALRPKHIGMVFQAPSLIPTLSAVENVEVPLRLVGGVSRGPRKVAMHILEELGLAAVADKLPDELSGGQAQRVALARAVVLKPRLVLADEPTGQLDQPTARQTIETLLNSIDGSDAALVIATHDPMVAERMKVTWLMDHGTLRAPQIGCANDQAVA
ncbi:MAG TPA: ATP-binding cassette domain-containing protein [Bradyrhizobium sp.]|jgi:ABC-type lipoprotein export system ATPase subunit|uniref:ABC transporter ATP-binding protein n=1 Tax=Bradyrhizobium sp. CCH5-F6 TaxID=1768753 RepID=UPI00076AA24E|nr:ATP-binding cassette domain-containing protein [Bradyrhizobium sp. CCH5-F6]HXH43386.1 ATP-binding cassette domain-containing protein [Bradyrhizobium sp.]